MLLPFGLWAPGSTSRPDRGARVCMAHETIVVFIPLTLRLVNRLEELEGAQAGAHRE